MKRIEPPNREIINAEYEVMSISALASKYATSRITVKKWLTGYGIPIRNQQEASNKHNVSKSSPLPDRQSFEEAYRSLNTLDCRTKFNIGQETFYKLIEQYGLNRNPTGYRFRSTKMDSWLSRMPLEEEVRAVYNQTKNIAATREILGVSDYSIRKLFKMYNIDVVVPSRSKAEIDLYDLCVSLRPDLTWEHNVRGIIYPYELDIVCRELELAIEYCGVYWHSEVSAGKSRDYHSNKRKLCENMGFQLLTIFETDPIEIVKSLIRVKLGKARKIMARKCSMREIDSRTARLFHQQNHMHGAVGARVHYGIYHEDELVHVTSFGKNRFSKDDSWECIRMTGKLNTVVVGGPSKVFKRFIIDHPEAVLTTFADLRFGSGATYSKFMERLPDSPPNYWYHQGGRLSSRAVFQKHKLKDLPSYQPELTEWQIMQLEGWDRIWDCGNAKFRIKLT